MTLAKLARQQKFVLQAGRYNNRSLDLGYARQHFYNRIDQSELRPYMFLPAFWYVIQEPIFIN